MSTLLLNDLESVRDHWSESAAYRKAFEAQDVRQALVKMLTGMGGLTKGETIIMGQLEDIRDELQAALTGIGDKMAALATKLDAEEKALAAALAAGQAPDPATIASIKALADHARDLAASTARSPAPAVAPTVPDPVVVVDPTPAPTT